MGWINTGATGLVGPGQMQMVCGSASIVCDRASGFTGIGTFSPSAKLDVNGDVTISGNVGIGTASPVEALHVCGNIRAEGAITAALLIVQALPGACPDYVFESDYELMPLDELSEYIQRNKHLPNVPSAEVVERDGVDLGGFSMRLLEKTEELTLYVLDQDKRLKEKDADLAELREEKDSEILALADRLAALESLVKELGATKGVTRLSLAK